MKPGRQRRLVSGLSILALVASACSGASRPDTLARLAQDSIVPTYTLLAANTERLQQATVDLCGELDGEALDRAHAALATASETWSVSEPMWIGPVMERRSWAVMDWPISPNEIEELIVEDGDLTVERLGSRVGADQRGLGAIEYLLGAPGDDAALLALVAEPRRCDYLTSVATVVADEALLVSTDWTQSFEEGDPYETTFALPETEALDDLVNDIVFLIEAMTDGELGTALGEMDREADLEAIVEGPAGLGADDLAGHLVGLRTVLVGANGTTGLRPLFEDDLARRLVEHLDAADVAVAQIDGPLRVAVEERSEEALAARTALKELQIVVNTEVVSVLGVTIGFSDADGDTG